MKDNLQVRIYPDAVLKKKAEVLDSFDGPVQELFDRMIETMYREDGVGLAAPQVGISKQILIASPTMKPGEEIVMANPEILESQGRESAPEGCLSLPGIAAEVVRAKKIRVRFQDRQGERREMEAKDFFARIIQHEVDHLNGMFFVDRLDFMKRQELLARFESEHPPGPFPQFRAL